MPDDRVQELVAAAVGTTFRAWATQHPALAAVIDQIRLVEQAAESLRQSPRYRQAVEAYHRDRDELALLGQLTALAEPLLLAVLGA